MAERGKEQLAAIGRLPLLLIPKSMRLAFQHRIREAGEVRKARAGKYMVLSRAKSGRTWVRAMLSRLYVTKYGLPEQQLLEYDNFNKQNPAVPKVFFTHGHYLQAKFLDPAWRQEWGSKRLVFLARNPCDIAVSEYFQSTKRAKAHKVELYGIDKEQSMFDFVMNGPMSLPTIIDYFNGWHASLAQVPNAMVVRYEDMRAEPVDTLSKLVRFLGEPFTNEEVREAVEFASFENLKELERKDFFNNSRLRAKDPNDPDSFKVRRGKVGGYRDYFDEEQIAAMEGLVRDTLVADFGYCRDDAA